MNPECDLCTLIIRGGIQYNVIGDSPETIYLEALKNIKLPKSVDQKKLYEELCQREELMSTAIGNGIALPHPRFPMLKEDEYQRVTICFVDKPILMPCPDAKAVYVLFILLTSNSQSHLKILSQLAFLFQKKEFRSVLERKPTEVELLTKIKELL